MQTVIIKDHNILGGEPVFRGTRVPFRVLDHATNRAFGFFLAITSSFSAA
jgi:hypothetical protein